jgi:hypothetical protein
MKHANEANKTGTSARVREEVERSAKLTKKSRDGTWEGVVQRQHEQADQWSGPVKAPSSEKRERR